MEVQELYTVLRAIESNILLVYFFALGFSVHRFRRINSTVLCIGLVFVLQSLMMLIRDPLLALQSREAWYGGWILFDVLTVFLLYKVHDILNVNLAKITNIVAFTYVVSAFIHTARYIERQHFGGEQLDAWYYIAVNTINISLAVIVLATAIKDKKEKLVGMYV